MILVDPRNGSKYNKVTEKFEVGEGLLPLLLGKGIEVEEYSMQFADFAFEGNGENGRCLIGIERKRITDLITCIRDGRLATTQLPGLWQMYQYRFLIVEGICRPAPNTGILEMLYAGKQWNPPRMGPRVPMYCEMTRALTTYQLQYPGLIVIKSARPQETVFHILDLYHYFNSKDWDEHRSHQAFQTDGHIEVFKASLLRRVAKELTKVGWIKSRVIDKTFSSVVEMANASLKDWEAVPGIGKILARKIFDELRADQ